MLAVPEFDAVQCVTQPMKSDFAASFSRQPLETQAAGSTIFFEGDPATHVFRIVSGNVRVFRLLPDGRRTIIGFLDTGSIVGLSFRSQYLFGAEAIDEVVFQRMSKRSLERELQLVPDYRWQLLSYLRDEITAAQDHMLLISNKNAEERLCSFLLHRIAPTCRCDGALIALPMIRADIADHLGMTIETVSRTLTKLVAKGVLLPAEKHQFKVVKLSALMHAADDHLEEKPFGYEVTGKRHAGTRSQ